MRLKGKRAVRWLAAGIGVIGSLFLLQGILTPKYADEIIEGALIAEYYDEEKDHDVIFLGDCEVYENFSPAVLWREYGINSYIRGSAQQLIWQSYYLLEDTLRYETPKVVVFNVLAMQYSEPQKEAYNRMTLDGMRWSSSKIKSVLESMTETERMEEYLFPILRYHSRWNDLSMDDLRYLFQKPKVSHSGYYMRTDVKPAGNFPEPEKLVNGRFGEKAYFYLDKMIKLCRDNGIQLVLIKAPSLYPHWYEEWDDQIVRYAEENELLYFNFLKNSEEIGLDYRMDTYDGGLHLNLFGAEKLSRYIGGIFMEHTDVRDRRNEQKLQEIWEVKLSRYDADRENLRKTDG